MGLEQDKRELSRDGAETLPARDTRPWCTPSCQRSVLQRRLQVMDVQVRICAGCDGFSRKAKEEKFDRIDPGAVMHRPLPKWRQIAREGGPSSRFGGNTQEKKVRSMRGE